MSPCVYATSSQIFGQSSLVVLYLNCLWLLIVEKIKSISQKNPSHSEQRQNRTHSAYQLEESTQQLLCRAEKVKKLYLNYTLLSQKFFRKIQPRLICTVMALSFALSEFIDVTRFFIVFLLCKCPNKVHQTCKGKILLRPFLRNCLLFGRNAAE